MTFNPLGLSNLNLMRKELEIFDLVPSMETLESVISSLILSCYSKSRVRDATM